MKFVLKPSLQYMTLVKIVVSLWNQNDIMNLISKLSSSSNFCTRHEQWKEIEQRVTEKMSLLSLPQLFKEKMLGIIKPIGLEIFMWIMHNHKHFHVNLLAELCWTPQGTVDRQRTAKVLVCHETLDVFTCYKIACIYCMEDDIIRFWNRLPENLKQSVSHEFPIINYWSRYMKRRELGIAHAHAHIDYKDQFHKSLLYWNNRTAADYFLQKLTPRERKESLLEAAKYVVDADALYFLISKINEDQQMKVFENNPISVLRCFLKWPLQSFFIETANCMWKFLSKFHYHCLCMDIVHKVEDGYNDWNYRDLFREFWQKSPDVKKLFIDEIDKSWLLPSLFRIKDKENIRLILKDVNLTSKEKLIYNYGIKDLFERSIYDNEWDILEFFIQECLPSKNAMLKFKEEFEKRTFFKGCSTTKMHQWNQLFSISKDSRCKCSKRSAEVCESTSSKHFRSQNNICL